MGRCSTVVLENEDTDMGRPKKYGTYPNICIETPIHERFEAVCDEAGQTKTVAVERALTAYLDSYEEKQKKLKRLNQERYKIENLFICIVWMSTNSFGRS